MLRLGCVGYLNAQPLIHGWKGAVHFDHPAGLARALEAGELDVALVSSFEYLLHPIYAAVDGISIASDGPVFSVIVAHAGSIENLREVIIDRASVTSINLLRCLLGDQKIQFVAEGEIQSGRGRLFIGDQAIRFREEQGERWQILDLGAAWQERMGLPFVYALWLIHPDYPKKAEIAEELRSLGQNNLRNLEAVIAAQPESRRSFCEFYFRRCLRFSFGPAEKKGFQKFAELCARQKLIPTLPRPPELV